MSNDQKAEDDNNDNMFSDVAEESIISQLLLDMQKMQARIKDLQESELMSKRKHI